MKKHFVIIISALLALAAVIAVVRSQQGGYHPRKPSNHPALRVVSLAPSITETVFALGAGDKLVGVTRYCSYPPQAKKIASVGGYIDPSIEAIIRLRPDLVIVTAENGDTTKRLNDLKIKTLVVHQKTISGILDSITKIGGAVGRRQKARELISDIRGKIDGIKLKTKDLAKPGVMVSIGRSMGSDIGEVYVAGKDDFCDEMIRITGGRNVAGTSAVRRTPVLSREGIIRLNPDVIIDLAPDQKGADVRSIIKDWSSLGHVSAVRNKRVYVLTGDYLLVPGPRLVRTLEDMAEAIHPEVKWSGK